MYHLEKSKTEDVSPKRAQEILTRRNTFEGQRPLGMPWANYLATAIKRKSLVKGAISFAQNGNTEQVVVNGQHTLQAIVLSETTLRCTVDEYHYDEPDDLWRLYATFDVGRSRSQRDIVVAARGLFNSDYLKNAPLRLLTVVGTALYYLASGKPVFGKSIHDKTIKPRLLQENEVSVRFVESVYAGTNMVPDVPISTAMIATWRKCEKASEFWPRVITGAELLRNSPEWHLARALGDQRTLSVRAALSKRGGGTGRLFGMWNLCIGWWNTYAAKETRNTLRLAALKELLEVRGCGVCARCKSPSHG